MEILNININILFILFLIDIEYLSFKRNNKIKDYFHKSTRFITNQLVSGHYNTVIIGYNKC